MLFKIVQINTIIFMCKEQTDKSLHNYNKYINLYPSCDFVLGLFMFTRFGTYVPLSEISRV